MKFLLQLLGISLSILACAPALRTVSSETVQLTLDVREERHSAPVAEVSLLNASGQKIGVTKTFGLWPYSWLGLFIEDAQGNRVPYPPEMPDLVLELPEYRCLRPGETLQWSIDLLDWRIEFGGEIWDEGLRFDLNPGSYRLQARYTDGPRRGRQKARVGCPVIDGTVVSGWKTFTFEQQEPARQDPILSPSTRVTATKAQDWALKHVDACAELTFQRPEEQHAFRLEQEIVITVSVNDCAWERQVTLYKPPSGQPRAVVVFSAGAPIVEQLEDLRTRFPESSPDELCQRVRIETREYGSEIASLGELIDHLKELRFSPVLEPRLCVHGPWLKLRVSSVANSSQFELQLPVEADRVDYSVHPLGQWSLDLFKALGVTCRGMREIVRDTCPNGSQ